MSSGRSHIHYLYLGWDLQAVTLMNDILLITLLSEDFGTHSFHFFCSQIMLECFEPYQMIVVSCRERLELEKYIVIRLVHRSKAWKLLTLFWFIKKWKKYSFDGISATADQTISPFKKKQTTATIFSVQISVSRRFLGCCGILIWLSFKQRYISIHTSWKYLCYTICSTEVDGSVLVVFWSLALERDALSIGS